jgi:hypothetical protein
LAAALGLLWLAAPAAAAVSLEVGGAVESSAQGLMVRLDVANRGDVAAERLDAEGELFGYHAEGALAGGLAAGQARSLWLHFPLPPPRPGLHALALHLRYPVPGASEAASQRAFLLLALGARVEPALRLSVAPAAFETSGALAVALESADGQAHAVRVRVLAPRGVNVLQDPEVEVPARGTATARVPLIRGGPSRRERQGLVVLAATTVNGVESTQAATTTVDLVPHLPLLPRLRVPLAVAGVVLLAAAVTLELLLRSRA